jgi:hypothetical protein
MRNYEWTARPYGSSESHKPLEGEVTAASLMGAHALALSDLSNALRRGLAFGRYEIWVTAAGGSCGSMQLVTLGRERLN